MRPRIFVILELFWNFNSLEILRNLMYILRNGDAPPIVTFFQQELYLLQPLLIVINLMLLLNDFRNFLNLKLS